MKKLISIVLICMLMLSIGASALAAGRHHMGMGKHAGRNFVDANGDGVCDNLGESCMNGKNFVDADGDGVCDNRGENCMNGKNFVDADGDGVCDNRGMRMGRGQHHGNRHHK